MIITMTGKPCAGKSVMIEFLAHKYGFDVFYSGALYREEAKRRGMTVLELNQLNDFKVDYLLDKKIMEEGFKRQGDEVVFDSRLAWAILQVPNLKTFLDVNEDEQARRLLGAGRSGDENSNITLEQAKKDLQDRWNAENDRYDVLYGVNNKNPKNYDVVLDTSNLTIEEGGEKVYEKYCSFKDTGKEKRTQERIAKIIEDALKSENSKVQTKNDELKF